MTSLLKTPKPPKIEPPAPMPDPDNTALQAQKRRQAAASLGQTGRASTMLSNRPQNKKLGE